MQLRTQAAARRKHDAQPIARWKLWLASWIWALTFTCAGCAAQLEPSAPSATSPACGLNLDARFVISVDGAQVFEGRAADFHALPCAAPVRSCSPWRATASCTAADGAFTSQTWTLDDNAGNVTLETETRSGTTTEELLLKGVS